MAAGLQIRTADKHLLSGKVFIHDVVEERKRTREQKNSRATKIILLRRGLTVFL